MEVDVELEKTLEIISKLDSEEEVIDYLSKHGYGPGSFEAMLQKRIFFMKKKEPKISVTTKVVNKAPKTLTSKNFW